MEKEKERAKKKKKTEKLFAVGERTDQMLLACVTVVVRKKNQTQNLTSRLSRAAPPDRDGSVWRVKRTRAGTTARSHLEGEGEKKPRLFQLPLHARARRHNNVEMRSTGIVRVPMEWKNIQSPERAAQCTACALARVPSPPPITPRVHPETAGDTFRPEEVLPTRPSQKNRGPRSL